MQVRALLTIWCLCASLSVCAQEEGIDTSIVSSHDLDEVVIMETRRRRQLSSTAPLHVFGRGELLSLGVTDIGDALHRLPGVILRDYGGAGGMKTVSVRGFGSKHTGVSYDGVMLSDCQSGEIDLSRYSLENVDELSLVIGDNDDIFIPARNVSTPSVLTVRTLRPPSADGSAHVTTQLKFGSFGYVSPFVRYEQSLSKHFALSATGEYVYAENDYPFILRNVSLVTHERRTNSRMNSGRGELDFIWNLNRMSRLNGKLYYYDNDRQLPGQVRYYTNLSKEQLHDQNFFGQLQYLTYCSEALALKLHGKFNWTRSQYRDGLMSGGVNDANYWQREAYASAALLYRLDDKWAFDYSGDYVYNTLNGSSWRTVVGHPYRHGILQSTTAKYSGGRLTVLGRLLCSLYFNGDREGGTHARNMRKLSPSVSLSYRLLANEELYIRASYKNIFRVPTFNESYYYHYGSTDLKAESTWQLNFGFTYGKSSRMGDYAQVSVDGYYNRVRDMIVAVPYNMFVWTCVNVDKVNAYGLDMMLKGCKVLGNGHRLLLSGGYSFQRVKNQNIPSAYTYGYQIAYMPKHSGNAALTYENPWVNISFHSVGTSSRWPNNEHYEGTMIAGYIDCGLTIYRDFQLGRSMIGCRLDLKNIFDKQYEIVARYPMPGRSYQFSIQYKF